MAAMCRSRLGILPSGLSSVGDRDGPRHGEAAWHAFGFGRVEGVEPWEAAENRLTVVGVELGFGESESGADAD